MSTIAAILRDCPVLSPADSVARAAEVMLDPACGDYLSLPVVDGLLPVGTLSRHALQQVYLSRFGRDLYSRKHIVDLMNTEPILIEERVAIEEASPLITAKIGFPIREDFIVVREGSYAGVGVVVDLLKAMESRVARRNEELATAYRQLKESQLQLVQSEKMASLGQMVAGVAHELNTPLGYVRNNVEMFGVLASGVRGLRDTCLQVLTLLEDPDAEPEVVREFVARQRMDAESDQAAMLADDLSQLIDDTLFGCNQIGALVGSLKDFSRMDRQATEQVDINECITSALLIARHALKDKAEVSRDDGVLPPLSCVPSQINQVLLNLLTNAAQAIDGRGRIHIRTRQAGDTVTISVQDNGKGMTPDVLQRIFDPFFTTKPVGQGTGLGLSICYRIVQEHGGSIRVASEPGRGTRFLVSLPVERQPAATGVSA